MGIWKGFGGRMLPCHRSILTSRWNCSNTAGFHHSTCGGGGGGGSLCSPYFFRRLGGRSVGVLKTGASFSSIERSFSSSVGEAEAKATEDVVIVVDEEEARGPLPLRSAPCLMLPSGTGLVAGHNGKGYYYKLVEMEDEKDYYRFFSLRENKLVKMRRNPRLILPWQRDILPPDEAICFGSSRGWLAFIHPRNCSLYLFNPFIHSQLPYLPLPPIQTLPSIISTLRHRDYSNNHISSSSTTSSSTSSSSINNKFNYVTEYTVWKQFNPISSQDLCQEAFFKKIVLSSDPSPFPSNHQHHHDDHDHDHGNQCTVMAIQGYETSNLAFCRIGDTAWTSLDGARKSYRDIIYFSKDQNFYAFDEKSKSIEAWDLCNPSSPKKTDIISDHIPPDHDQRELDRYLVESSGELLMVVRYYTYHHPRNTIAFDVYKLDFVNKDWLLFPSLGHNRALFIGINDAISVSHIDFPGLPMNCIYFTSPDPQFLEDSCDLGIFNLEDQRVTPIYYYDSDIELPSPWIVPSAQQ